MISKREDFSDGWLMIVPSVNYREEELESRSNSFENALIQKFIHRKIYESWRFVFLKFEKIFIIRVSTDRIR